MVQPPMRVTFKADIALIDECEAAQIRQTIRPAKAIGERGRIAVAVAGLVQRQDHITAPCKFNRKSVPAFRGN